MMQTFQLLSDGKTLYWLYAVHTQQDTITHPVSGDKIKQYPLFLHTVHVKVSISRARLAGRWARSSIIGIGMVGMMAPILPGPVCNGRSKCNVVGVGGVCKLCIWILVSRNLMET